MNNTTEKVTTIGHNLVDEIQQMSHEFINNAVELSIPIINTMAQTNINIPKKLDNINYYRKNTNNKILLICELPGVSKKNCKINFSNGILRISGHTCHNDEWEYISDKNSKNDLNPECKIKSIFINQLYIELGTTPSGINHTTRPCFFMVSLTFLVCKFTKQKFSYFCPSESRRLQNKIMSKMPN